MILNQIGTFSRVQVAFGLVSYLNINTHNVLFTNNIRSVQKKALVFGSHRITPGHPYWMHLCRLQYINAYAQLWRIDTQSALRMHTENPICKRICCAFRTFSSSSDWNTGFILVPIKNIKSNTPIKISLQLWRYQVDTELIFPSVGFDWSSVGFFK